MAERTRFRKEPGSSGYLFAENGGTTTYYENLSKYESITDHVGPGDGGPLFIRKVTCTGGQVADSWTRRNSGIGAHFVNLQGERMRNPLDAMYAHATDSARPNDGMLAAKLLAETNPSRPVVDLPIYLWELKDIPGLLKNEGDDLIQKLAVNNLKWQFAIKPLISDLTALLNFSDEVDKRQKELDSFFESGLRRKRDLYRGSSTTVTNTITQSGYDHYFVVESQVSTRSRSWGFVEWFPSDITIMKGDRRELARKCVLGLTIDFSTAWNAIPWSWLIDWCSNVGDLLTASRNLVGAVHGPVQIMEHIKTDALHKTTSWPGVAPGAWSLETKRRTSIVNVPISAQLPILSLRQISILGSIAVTRRAPKS